MITNLFSIFDPLSRIGSLPLNWLSLLLGIIILPYWFWITPSRFSIAVKKVENRLGQEISLLLGYANKSLTLIFISLFFFIIINNRFGLFPYIFTASAHLTLTLSLALPLWFGYFLYGWFINTTHILAHLIPQGTPRALIPFIVIIESVRRLIRPITLAVRLAANIIAGHLLLTLIRGRISIFSLTSLVGVSISQVLLVLLERAVALIQAYVFAVLMTLYAREV